MEKLKEEIANLIRVCTAEQNRMKFGFADHYADKILDLVNQRAEPQCEWRNNKDREYPGYETNCNEEYHMYAGGTLGENVHHYCPKCGGKIISKE